MTDKQLTERALQILARDLADLGRYDRPEVTAQYGVPDTRVVHTEIRDAVAALLLDLGRYAAARGIVLDQPTT